jgi:hypothetical protein
MKAGELCTCEHKPCASEAARTMKADEHEPRASEAARMMKADKLCTC